MMSLGYLKGRLGEIKLAYRLLEYILHTKFYHCWYYHHQYLPSWCIIPRQRNSQSPRGASQTPAQSRALRVFIFVNGGVVLFCFCFVSRWVVASWNQWREEWPRWRRLSSLWLLLLLLLSLILLLSSCYSYYYYCYFHDYDYGCYEKLLLILISSLWWLLLVSSFLFLLYYHDHYYYYH